MASFVADHDADRFASFVRGSGMNEARGNGTPFQTNGTRLWRYATGADWQGPRGDAALLRLYGSTEHYRQTFSSITQYAHGRRSRLRPIVAVSRHQSSRWSRSMNWARPRTGHALRRRPCSACRRDSHDVRYWDREQSLGSSTQLTNLHDHQRDSGLYGEVMWTHHAWTASGSARMDWYQNYDGRQLTWNSLDWLPSATQPIATG
jgi:hypothetical protein